MSSIDPNYDPDDPNPSGIEKRKYGVPTNEGSGNKFQHRIYGNNRNFTSDDDYYDDGFERKYKGPHSTVDHAENVVLFGIDYPEACSYSVKVATGENVSSNTLTIYFFTVHEEWVKIIDKIKTSTQPEESHYEYNYKKVSESSWSSSDNSNRGFTASRRFEASTPSHIYTYKEIIDGKEVTFTEYVWADGHGLTLFIPNSVMKASTMSGGFYGFPHYPDVEIPDKYDGSLWTLDGNFYGFPYLKNIGIAPKFDGFIWTMDGNFYGFPYIKNSGIAPEYQSSEKTSKLYYDSGKVKKLYYMGQEVKKCYFNGALVFESG